MEKCINYLKYCSLYVSLITVLFEKFVCSVKYKTCFKNGYLGVHIQRAGHLQYGNIQ